MIKIKIKAPALSSIILSSRVWRSRTLTTAYPLTPPPPRRGFRRPILWSTLFLILGIGSGSFIRLTVIPPALPIPGSVEDRFALHAAKKRIDQIPLVQELRAHDDWTEHEAYASLPSTAGSFTAGALTGSGHLGQQYIFWNAKEKRSISVMAFGGAMCGWPGVTHGGAIATILQENMERVANGGVDGSGTFEMDEMELNYVKPTNATRIFVIRAEHDEARSASRGKGCFKATLEDLELKDPIRPTCVEALGSCRLANRNESLAVS